MSRKSHRVGKLWDIDLREYSKKAKEWLSDLDFLDGELKFFQKILKLHFADTADPSAHQAEEVEKQLGRLKMNRQFTRADVINHYEMLDLLIKDLISQEEEVIRHQHETLQVKIIGLEQAFKMFKTEFFRKTEKVPDFKSSQQS